MPNSRKTLDDGQAAARSEPLAWEEAPAAAAASHEDPIASVLGLGAAGAVVLPGDAGLEGVHELMAALWASGA